MGCASNFMHFPDSPPGISNAPKDIGLPTAVLGQKAFTYRKG